MFEGFFWQKGRTNNVTSEFRPKISGLKNLHAIPEFDPYLIRVHEVENPLSGNLLLNFSQVSQSTECILRQDRKPHLWTAPGLLGMQCT